MTTETWDTGEVGRRIRAIRLRRGWSGRELARRAHVQHTQLQKIEAGESPQLPWPTVQALLSALEISPQAFFTDVAVEDLVWQAQVSARGEGEASQVSPRVHAHTAGHGSQGSRPVSCQRYLVLA